MLCLRLATRPVCRLLLVAAASAVLSSPVIAQDRDRNAAGGGGGPTFRAGGPGGFGGFGNANQAVSQADVERFEKMLGLTAAQKETFKKSFNTYKAQYEAEEAAMQERIDRLREDAQDSGDMSALRNMGVPMQEFRESAVKMEETLMKDLRRVLTAEQKENWVKLERARRRDKATSGMMVANAERIDLVKIVEELKLPADLNASLAPTLEQYETELDKELINRAKVNDEVTAAMAEMRNNRGGAGAGGGGAAGGFQAMMEKMRPTIDKARTASGKVQEVNRRYAAKIQASLPEDRRPAFAKAVKEAKFPDIYRETTTSRRLAAASEFTDLDDKQKAALKGLVSQYNKELNSVNERLAAATEKDEARRLADPNLGFGRGSGAGGQGGNQQRGGQGQGGQGGGRGGQGGGQGGGRGGQGGGGQPPAVDPASVNGLRQEKRSLDNSTMDSLRKLLNQDQQDRLPRADPRDRQFGGFTGAGQGGGGGQGNQRGGQRQNRGGGGGG